MIEAIHTISCDNCGREIQQCGGTVGSARRSVKELGWKVTAKPDGRDRCPRCLRGEK